VTSSGFSMVANTVAVASTSTERLVGSTAANGLAAAWCAVKAAIRVVIVAMTADVLNGRVAGRLVSIVIVYIATCNAASRVPAPCVLLFQCTS